MSSFPLKIITNIPLILKTHSSYPVLKMTIKPYLIIMVVRLILKLHSSIMVLRLIFLKIVVGECSFKVNVQNCIKSVFGECDF